MSAEAKTLPVPHVWPVRVYYEDTDAGGVVYHANYLRFAERARTEMLRAAGYDQSRLREEQGMGIVVRSGNFHFLAPARLDDRLEVETRVTAVGAASLEMEQHIHRLAPLAGEEKALLFTLEVKLACLNDTGRPRKWPDSLRAAFAVLQERE